MFREPLKLFMFPGDIDRDFLGDPLTFPSMFRNVRHPTPDLK